MKKDKIVRYFPTLLLSLLALGIYLNSLNNSFIFDDISSIVENPYIRNLKDISFFLKGLEARKESLRALPTLSFAINYHFHKLNVFGYHLVNLVFHILSGLLVYFISKYLFILESKGISPPPNRPNRFSFQKIDILSFLAAALFISHPIQVNTVTYIVERNEGMASFFYLLGFFLFIKMSLSNSLEKGLYLLGTVIAFLLAILSKEISFTFPIILVLFDLMFICQNWKTIKTRLKFYIGFGAPLILYILFFFKGGIIKLLFEYRGRWTPWENLLTQFNVIIQYIKLLFLPLPSWLNVDHDFQLSKSLLEYPTWISLSLILILFILAIFMIKKSRIVSFSVFFFFIVLSPSSSVIPIWDLMVEYRLYLPLFAFCLILTKGLYSLYQLLTRYYSYKLSRGVVLGISVIILSSYSAITIDRNKIFEDELILWSDAAKKSPNKTRPKENLITAYHRHGLYDQAIALSLEVLNKKPRDPEIYNKLGISYMSLGEYDKAIEYLKISIQMRDNNPKAFNNLGIIYLEKKDFPQAITAFKQAISQKSNYSEAYNNLAKALAMTGQLDDAVIEESKAIRIDSTIAEYRFNLAKLYENKGLINEAVREYKEALRLNPKFFEAYYHLGIIYTKIERPKEAIIEFEEAIKINPKSGKIYFILGVNFLKVKNREKAILNLEIALQYATNEKDKNAIQSILKQLRSAS